MRNDVVKVRSWWQASTSASTIPVRGAVPLDRQHTYWGLVIEFTCETAPILLARCVQSPAGTSSPERLANRSWADNTVVARGYAVTLCGTQAEPVLVAWRGHSFSLGFRPLPQGAIDRYLPVEWGEIRCGVGFEALSQRGGSTTLICVTKDDTYNTRGRWLVKPEYRDDLPVAFRALAGTRGLDGPSTASRPAPDRE